MAHRLGRLVIAASAVHGSPRRPVRIPPSAFLRRERPPTVSNSRTVIVCLPAGQTADWFSVSEILDWLGQPACTPQVTFPVRRGKLLGWISRWTDKHLVDPVRRFGAVTRAAGGRVGRLDLTAKVTHARTKAIRRWQAWNAHIARTTPQARTWESFRTEHERDPKKLPMEEARRRFEAQPRVLAMLSYSSYPMAPCAFDPYELEAYQAGEAVYVAVHWQSAIAGDALVNSDGQLIEPKSGSLADRLRYLADASRTIHKLKRSQHLVAVTVGAQP